MKRLFAAATLLTLVVYGAGGQARGGPSSGGLRWALTGRCAAREAVAGEVGDRNRPSGTPCTSDGLFCNGAEECASGLCDADAGTCFDATALLYVTATGGSADLCTQAAPCALDHAISLAMPNPAKSAPARNRRKCGAMTANRG